MRVVHGAAMAEIVTLIAYFRQFISVSYFWQQEVGHGCKLSCSETLGS